MLFSFATTLIYTKRNFAEALIEPIRRASCEVVRILQKMRKVPIYCHGEKAEKCHVIQESL